ncbi:MAG: tetratricopeptide repeat protein [Anaerolineales bacterium]|nr:tetratricopeptide repeat protein [Anaerolineales bacterium]
MADFCARGGGAASSATLRNDIAYYRAVADYELGRQEEAIAALERVLAGVRTQSLFGPGVGDPVLPGLHVIRFTDRQVDRLHLLHAWLQAAGRTDEARGVYQEILEVAPDRIDVH